MKRKNKIGDRDLKPPKTLIYCFGQGKMVRPCDGCNNVKCNHVNHNK